MKSFFKKNFWLFTIIFIAAVVRFYQLSLIPPSLSWDEAAIGWNAKSLFHTRRDEYGTLLPLVFKSFGDYKAPLYIYLTAPIVGFFGLNIINIRFISALSGVLSAIFLSLIVIKLTKNKNLGYLSGFLLAVNPWSIMLSRGAFEQNLSVTLILMGVYFFFVSFKKTKLLLLSSLFFSLSLYAYHSAKIFTPLLVLGLIILYKDKLFNKKLKKKSIFLSIFTIFLLLPLIYSTLFSGATLRFKSTSIFNQDDNQIILSVGTNYLKHFSPSFLFSGGYQNYRQQMQKIGPLLLIEAPFLLIGLFYILKNKNKKINRLLIFWLLIGPLAATITKEAPHQIRSFNIFPSLIIIIAFGVNKVINFNKLLKHLTYFLFIFNLIIFFIHYFKDYKIYSAKDWQYGYQQVAQKSKQLEDRVDKINITSQYGQPYIFTLVYQQRHPVDVFNGAMSQYLYRDINWYEDQMTTNKLYFGTPEEIPIDDPRVIKIIYYPDQTPVFVIAKT